MASTNKRAGKLISASVPKIKTIVRKANKKTSTLKGRGKNVTTKVTKTIMDADTISVVTISKATIAPADLSAVMGVVPTKSITSTLVGKETIVAMEVKVKGTKKPNTKKASEAKAKIIRPKEPVKLWFVIAYLEGKSKVLSHGTQVECLSYIADIVKKTPNLRANVFIAGGLQLIAYDGKVSN